MQKGSTLSQSSFGFAQDDPELVEGSKGFAQLLIILTALLVLIGGGVYLYQGTQDNLPSSTKPTPQAKLEFQDYSSQNLGFKFKYPTDLAVKEDTEEEFNKRGNGNFRKNFTSYVAYEPGKFLGAVVVLGNDENFDTSPFTVWVFDNPNDLSIDEWYKSYWYYPFVWGDFTYTGKFTLAPKEEATISGQMGKSGVIDYQEGKPKFIYLSKDKKMYLFRVIGETGDQILSSFKFLNQKAADCKVIGCSGQICSDQEIITTCEWIEAYACYQTAKCERQSDGKCGWTQTADLTRCLGG